MRLRTAASGSDRDIPRTLWTGHLPDGEGSMTVQLRAALADYPHVIALKDGAVRSDRIAFEWETVTPITRAFRRMVRTGDFDLCEIALTTLAQARAFGKELTGLPVVMMRGFHHAALVCPVGSPLRGPKDLLGQRVGVLAFSQTSF